MLTLLSIGEYPSSCELEAVRLATIEACDLLDGVEDGIIMDPSLCNIDLDSIVGKTYPCAVTGEEVSITRAATAVAKEVWTGPVDTDGTPLWYGLTPGSPFEGLANTSCVNDTCVSNPFSISTDWISIYLMRDADFDPTTLNRTNFRTLFRRSKHIYDSIMGTNSADLTEFRDAGGKLLSWHSLSDQLLFPQGTANYAERVRAFDPRHAEYYRYFEAPGLTHCGAGSGWYPGDALAQLVEWVEHGSAPDTLDAKAVPDLWGIPGGAKTLRSARLCLFPKKMVYMGGDADLAESFECQ
jgi:hypothetical protein